MVVLISGASHVGKTLMAQHMLERYSMPYLSLDHLKMGLIRSHQTALTPYDDELLTSYLWPITCDMIKTVIENEQHLIIEGCYIPFNWQHSFSERYTKHIGYLCIALSDAYIDHHFNDVITHESCIEHRLYTADFTLESFKQENHKYIEGCMNFDLPLVIVHEDYKKELEDIDALYQRACSIMNIQD